MKVLLINTSENKGGAAVACNRLMKALRASGVEAKMLVRDKRTTDEDVISVNSSWVISKINKFRFLWERFVIWTINGFSRKNLFALSIANTGMDISRLPEVQEADIIHLHWINHGFLSLRDIKKLVALGKPVVWTMHDMWPATGICHHSWECVRYQQKCGNCFYLKNPTDKDLAFKTWKKKIFLNATHIKLVTVSGWLRQKTMESSLTGKLEAIVIPNVLDLHCFYPKEKQKIRQDLNIPLSAKVILFGAARIDDPIKGFDLLKKILAKLRSDNSLGQDLFLLLFGRIKDPEVLSDLPCHSKYMGSISDSNVVAELYSAADVTVVTSHYETFGQTLIESMACGTPVVSFNNGGQTDIITHLQDGYLVSYPSLDDFVKGIEWTLEVGPEMSKSCIKKVQEEYAQKIIANKYTVLYDRLLENKEIFNC